MSVPSPKTDQKHRTEEKEDRRKAIKFYGEITGLVVLTIYTIATIALWSNSAEQIQILRESRDRPWIKFSEDILESGITFKPPSSERREPSIGIEHSFRFENLGKLPARNYAVSVRTFYFDDVHGMENWTHTNWKRPTCDAAQSRLRAVVNGMLIKGNVMFPGPATYRVSEQYPISDTVKNIEIVTVASCIAYEDVSGNVIHETAVLYCSLWPEGESPKPQRVLDKPEIWWNHPTSTFKPCMADAD